MKKITLCFIIIIAMFSSISVYSQTRDNLSQIYYLADSTVTSIIDNNNLNNLIYYVKLIAPDNFSLIKNRVLFSFQKNGITDKVNINKFPVVYSITNAGIEYTDIFRNGWFGDYFVERKTFLKGYFSIIKKDSSISNDFYYSKIDTIKYDNIKLLENASVPFTKNQIPTEPLLSSIFEPIIAVGTVIVTVFLLFNVRSK